MAESTPRLWRSVVRITRVTDDRIQVKVVGWDWDPQLVMWFRDMLPEPLRSAVEPGLRLHVHAHLGAEGPSEMMLEDWEWDGRSVAEQAERIRKATASFSDHEQGGTDDG